MVEFKIGDLVKFDIKDAKGIGELLAISSKQPFVTTWVVLIRHRDTEFLKQVPEKALLLPENYFKLINKNADKIEEL